MQTIVIADDHPMMASGLHALLKLQPNLKGHHFVCVASTEELEEIIAQVAIALIILDLDIPGAKGLSTLIETTKKLPDTPVVVVSANTHCDIEFLCANQGAWDYVNKSSTPNEIVAAAVRAITGERRLSPSTNSNTWHDKFSSLTPKQTEIFNGVIQGKLNKQIAYDLNISETTVKSHMTVIFEKLNVRNRKQLIVEAQSAI